MVHTLSDAERWWGCIRWAHEISTIIRKKLHTPWSKVSILLYTDCLVDYGEQLMLIWLCKPKWFLPASFWQCAEGKKTGKKHFKGCTFSLWSGWAMPAGMGKTQVRTVGKLRARPTAFSFALVHNQEDRPCMRSRLPLCPDSIAYPRSVAAHHHHLSFALIW